MRNHLKLIVNNDKKKNDIFFIKEELRTILNLYARMVSNGAWKDYGLTLNSKEVSFDVYQRASDKPIFKILKTLKPQKNYEKFLLKDKDGRIIKKDYKLIDLINKTNWKKIKEG
tara:strand:- start:757 stop:1098 length:342 start_codon:yes stop_codon:yes gene_type:complete